jgi:ornithine cyclodeaminase/alanine dehydrogenase
LSTDSQAQSPVFVSSAAAEKVFDWPSAIAALQDAYSQPEEPRAAPPRTIAATGDAWLRCLPAVPPGGRYFGAKLMGMATGAPDPACQYVIVLFDRERSRIAGFVDGEMVTAYRTAATTAAAVDRMAPKAPLSLAVLGSGLEATMHARAFAAIRELSAITVFSPTAARREQFARSIAAELGVAARAAESAEDAVRGADLVLAAARSRGELPILFGDWLRPGALAVSIGSTVPAQREIDVSVVAQSDIVVCDAVHEVVEETGDMIAAAQAGLDVRGKCFAMTALMNGELASRLEAARFPLFKSVGGGLQDVVVAGMILERARAAGLATPLPIRFAEKRV